MGCEDLPSGPTGNPYVIVVEAGGGQVGAPGWALDQEVRVRLEDRTGASTSGQTIRFTASGDGWVIPSEAIALAPGVGTRWVLGSAEGPQTLRIATPGADTVALTATATRSGMDIVLVVLGALAPLKGVVVADPYPLEIVTWWAGPDTVVALPPSAARRELLVLSYGNRPARVTPAIDGDSDTVRVQLRPPVAIDIAFDVWDGDYELRRDQIADQLAAAQSVWSAVGMGIVIDQLSFIDNTLSGPAHIVTGELCTLPPGSIIEVAVVTSIDGDRNQWVGYACGSRVFLNRGFHTVPLLLAHELGHTFNLVHTPTGVMAADYAPWFHDGEILAAHFAELSALNLLFDGQPTEHRFECWFGAGPACPPPLFNLRAP